MKLFRSILSQICPLITYSLSNLYVYANVFQFSVSHQARVGGVSYCIMRRNIQSIISVSRARDTNLSLLIRRSPGKKTIVNGSVLMIFIKNEVDALNQQCPTTSKFSSSSRAHFRAVQVMRPIDRFASSLQQQCGQQLVCRLEISVGCEEQSS